MPADKGRVTVVMDKTDHFDKMAYEELTKNLNATRRQHFYVNSTAKYLRLRRLTLLTLLSRRKLQSTENFIDAIKTVQIHDDYKLVSFDVKSLFTSISLQLALQCTETAIQQSTVELPLPTADIMDLLNLCITSTYFQYNGKHYKQLHGTAMGSHVSVVVAEIVMQHVEERALATCRQTIPLWLRYVDDTFTAVHKDEIDAFHDHLNEQNADMQFSKEIEENGKLPFLDCLVSRGNNELRTTVYRKPTHTDRLLDESSGLQPDFTQSDDYKDFDETSATSL